LHRFDPKSRTLEKVWNTTIEKRKSKVPASSLVPSEDHDGFYALLFDNSQYHTHLRLAKIKKDIPEVNFYQDSIPYTFLDTDSWSTLYLNENSRELIALTHHGDEIKLFSQAFPPMLPADIHQDIASPFHWKERALWLTGILALFVILALVFKRKRKIPLPLHEGLPVSEVKAVIPPRSGGFYFLGGFLVFDSTGKDITSEFTPTLKLLFLLIYFYSARSGKGINSTQLTEYIWPEKTDNSARNNRNVNIRKLRLLLEKTGNVEVRNDNTYWKIVLPDNVCSDYEHLYGLADQVKSFKSNLNDQGLAEFLHYAEQGELCPSVQTEWIDKYKVDLSNRIIDELSVLLEAIPWEKANYALMAQIASTILKHDVLNEEALQIKCTALYLMGKKGIAKHCYDKFCTEYKNSMGSDFPMKFKSLLKVYS
jgi:DNA-binding SARP family transcriptional activator